MTVRNCVRCGAQLPMESAVVGDLGYLGYLHNDVSVDCEECGQEHTFGVPVDSPVDQPPKCPVCGGRWFPYKVDGHRGWPDIDVHWKCEECWYFENRSANHLTKDVYGLGLRHLEGRRQDD